MVVRVTEGKTKRLKIRPQMISQLFACDTDRAASPHTHMQPPRNRQLPKAIVDLRNEKRWEKRNSGTLPHYTTASLFFLMTSFHVSAPSLPSPTLPPSGTVPQAAWIKLLRIRRLTGEKEDRHPRAIQLPRWPFVVAVISEYANSCRQKVSSLVLLNYKNNGITTLRFYAARHQSSWGLQSHLSVLIM